MKRLNLVVAAIVTMATVAAASIPALAGPADWPAKCESGDKAAVLTWRDAEWVGNKQAECGNIWTETGEASVADNGWNGVDGYIPTINDPWQVNSDDAVGTIDDSQPWHTQTGVTSLALLNKSTNGGICVKFLLSHAPPGLWAGWVKVWVPDRASTDDKYGFTLLPDLNAPGNDGGFGSGMNDNMYRHFQTDAVGISRAACTGYTPVNILVGDVYNYPWVAYCRRTSATNAIGLYPTNTTFYNNMCQAAID